jgi:hypothetical protein
MFSQKETTNQSVEDYIKRFKETWIQTQQNLKKAAEQMKKQHNKHIKPSRKYKPGNRVYLDASNIQTTCASKKLDAKFHRLFKVISAVGKSAYKLELPKGWLIHDTFHESKLKPVYELQFPKQKILRPRPPPEIIDGEEEHEVEEVQKVRLEAGKKKFLIKWKGLPQEENTWELEDNMKNARGAIRDFYKSHPNTIRNVYPLPSSPTSPRNLPFTIPPNPPLPYPESLLPLYTPHPRLYGWDDKKFDKHYRHKLEKLWYHWKSARKEAYSEED